MQTISFDIFVHLSTLTLLFRNYFRFLRKWSFARFTKDGCLNLQLPIFARSLASDCIIEKFICLLGFWSHIIWILRSSNTRQNAMGVSNIYEVVSISSCSVFWWFVYWDGLMYISRNLSESCWDVTKEKDGNMEEVDVTFRTSHLLPPFFRLFLWSHLNTPTSKFFL